MAARIQDVAVELSRSDQSRFATRLASLVKRQPLLVDITVLGIALAIFLASVLPNLANYPVLTDDEAWVMSASFKLAKEGVFGSDMFAGFFNADHKYFFNMPAHHFVLAGLFKLIGAGIAEARIAGVAYGVATLLLAYFLALKVYSFAAATLAVGLLLFLRLNMGFDTGLPLQELSVNMRYDLAPVPFMLAGTLVLLGGPSVGRSAVAGALFGAAVLMQFYGAFILPLAVAFLWLEALPAGRRFKFIGALIGSAALVGLPYAVYVLSNYDDFEGQAGTIDRRADIHKPSFYLDNLIEEPERFVRPLAIPFAFTEVPQGQDPFVAEPGRVAFVDALVRRPSAKLGVIAGLPLALAFLGWRAFRGQSRSDRLLLLCLAGLVAQYALLESTKFFFYWIPVVPFLCIGIAGAISWIVELRKSYRFGIAIAAVSVVAMLFVFAEGSAARINGLRTAPAATEYDTLSASLHQHVPPDSRVVGATSLWWGLRDTEYRSYFLFFYLTRPDAGTYRTSISDFLDSFGAEYIVLTRVASSELSRRLAPRDVDDFQSYLAERASKVARLEGGAARPYGFVDIWRIDRGLGHKAID